MSVDASNTAAGSSPGHLIDGTTATAWTSGGFSVQWIQVDLQQIRPVCRLKLTVAQAPAGQVKHTVLIGNSPDALSTASVIERSAADGDEIDVVIQANTRYIRIRTDASPSWVSWREMRVYSAQGAALPSNAAGLRYFGFWSAGGSEDASDPTPNSANATLYNATQEVHDYTNYTTSRVWFLDKRVNQLDALGKGSSKVFLDLYDIFFNEHSHYTVEWQAQGMDQRLSNYGDRVAAIMLVDEPDLRSAVTDAALSERIVFLKQRLAALGKNIPVFIDYSYLAFDTGNWPGFAQADWVSFNCYPQGHHPGSTLWNRYDVCYQGNTIVSYVTDLKAKLTGSQKIVLLPQSFYQVQPGSGPTSSTAVPATDKKHIVEILDHFMLLAENDSKVIAVMNFIYQSLDAPASVPAEAWIGAEWLDDASPDRDVRGRLMEAGLCHGGGFVGCLPRRLRPTAVEASDSVATAGAALDDDIHTSWSAGGYSSPGDPRWIRMFFPRQIGISEVRLVPSQAPQCAATTHEIWGGNTVAAMTRLAQVSGNTCDAQSISVTEFWRNNDIAVLEVRTIASPSWVAWRDIRVFR